MVYSILKIANCKHKIVQNVTGYYKYYTTNKKGLKNIFKLYDLYSMCFQAISTKKKMKSSMWGKDKQKNNRNQQKWLQRTPLVQKNCPFRGEKHYKKMCTLCWKNQEKNQKNQLRSQVKSRLFFKCFTPRSLFFKCFTPRSLSLRCLLYRKHFLVKYVLLRIEEIVCCLLFIDSTFFML